MKKSVARSLQHQVKILENFSTSEIEQEKWQEKLSVYAEIKPICDNRFTSIEHVNFGHIMTEGFYLFKIRFIKDITTKMRISFRDRQFEIKRIINVAEQSKFLNIIGLAWILHEGGIYKNKMAISLISGHGYVNFHLNYV